MKKFILSRTSRSSRHIIVWIDVDKFEALWKKDELYVGPSGSKGIGDRYKRFEEFWKTHDEIEVPEVYIGEDYSPSTRVGFGNGRHRYAYMRDIGYKAIPMAMPKRVAKYASEHGFVSSWRPIMKEEVINSVLEHV